jgi:hypothetical protein
LTDGRFLGHAHHHGFGRHRIHEVVAQVAERAARCSGRRRSFAFAANQPSSSRSVRYDCFRPFRWAPPVHRSLISRVVASDEVSIQRFLSFSEKPNRSSLDMELNVRFAPTAVIPGGLSLRICRGRSDRLNQSPWYSWKCWPLLVLSAFGYQVWPRRPDNGLNSKIYRQSPDDALRLYRGVARSSPSIPRSRAGSAGCGPRRFWRRASHRTGAPPNLRVTERAAQSGAVGLTGILESRSPPREYVDRFQTPEEGFRGRSSCDCGKWPCASTHRRDRAHRARSTEDPRITRTKT